MSSPSIEPVPPRSALDGLEVLDELGRGALSSVFRARRDGADYAVKVQRNPTAGAQGLQAFRREAAVLAHLHHPGLVEIHAVGEAEGRPHLVMEFVEGRTLQTVLSAAHGPIPQTQVVAIAIDCAGALATAHRAGLVHRDIKPANIIVQPDNRAKLIDFGLVTQVGEQQSVDVAVGTLRYSPPEQTGMLKRPVDGRSDLYSLGVVMYEALSGQVPFDVEDVGEMVRMHAVTQPDLSVLPSSTAPALKAVIERLLAKDPDDRYQTGEGLVADLQRIAADPRADFEIGAEDDPSRFDHDLPLAGRSRELGELTERWHDATRGRGCMVVVHGHPGEGKSRLLRELQRGATDHGELVMAGKAVQHDPSPLGPLRGALEQHIASIDRVPEERAEELRRRIRAAAAEAGGDITAVSPRLAALLPGSDRDVERGDHEQYFTAVASFFAALAAQHHGGLLVIDDAQWLDPASQRVLELMTTDLPTSPLLVALTARRDEHSAVAVDQLLTRLGEAVRTEITLAPLDETATGVLVREQLGGIDVDDAFVAQLHNRSGGNPFAAVEYLRAILHAGLIRPSWGRLLVDQRGLDDLNLPNDVIDLVLERVGRLGDEARAILTAGAAMGTRFSPSVAAAALQIDARGAELAVTDALRERLVERTGNDECGFVHDRIREALLEPLDDGDLRRLHQLVAEALEQVDSSEPDHIFAVAHHFSAGCRKRTPAKVLEWSTRAGHTALAGYANEHAAALFSDAASAAAQLDVELDADFNEAWSHALLGVGDSVGAERCIDAVLASSTDPQQRARVLLTRAESRNGVFDPDGAARAAERGLGELGRVPARRLPGAMLQSLRATLATVWSWVARRGGRRKLSANEAHRLDLELDLSLALGYAHYLRMQPVALLQVLAVALPLAARRGASPATGRIVGECAVVAAAVGLHPVRRRLTRRARRMATASGDRRALAHAELYDFLSLEAAGKTREAGELADGLIEEHGRWLRLGDLLTGVSAVAFNLDLRGYSREALREWHSAHERARHALEASENPYLLMGWVSLEILGERVEAAKLREAARAIGERSAGERFRRQTYLSAVIRYLRDQGEYGEELRSAVAESEALDLNPLTASVWLQSNFSQPLRMWLEIAQRTAGAEREGALAEARRRRRRMRFIRFVPLMHTYNLAAYASMAQIEGKPRKAMRLAAKTERMATKLDAPFLHYEVARVRARVAADRDDAPEHRRQVREAMRLASDGGWATRVEALRAEFGAVAGLGLRVGRSEHSGPNGSRTSRHQRTVGLTRTTDISSRGSLHGTEQSSSTANAGGGSLRGQRSLDALLALSLAASQTHDPRELARVGLDQIIGLLGAERAFLFLLEGCADEMTLSAARDADGQSLMHETSFARTIVERVRLESEPLIVSGSDEAGALGSTSAIQHGLRSIIAAPLQLEGRMLGVVYLDSRLARGIFTGEDIDILGAISTQIAIAIETARAGQLELTVATEREQRDLAEALRAAGEEISETLDPVEVLDRTLHAAARIIPYDRAGALVIDSGSARWTLAASAGDLDHETAVAGLATAAPDNFLEALTASSGPQGRPRILPGSAPVAEILGDAESWLCVPMVARGELRGAVLMGAREPGALGEAQLELAATFAGQGTVAYENARLFEAVEQMATTDELTQVNNRRHFFTLSEPQFDTAKRYAMPLSVVMLDIDHFKRVNDVHGHAAGDDVIRTVAARMTGLIRSVDVIGRYGGEEFALLLPCTGQEARVLAERLRETVAGSPIDTCSGPLDVTISLGVAVVEAADESLAATLSRADAALYEAKGDGRNCVRMHAGDQAG